MTVKKKVIDLIYYRLVQKIHAILYLLPPPLPPFRFMIFGGTRFLPIRLLFINTCHSYKDTGRKSIFLSASAVYALLLLSLSSVLLNLL
ncbi:hypothetical protein BDB00DRAFT_816485 [Zychaea mexicana]|uniref:uncharacterized protein n=1 Tax=Zychaea mexicana TaxID=64656 RepID=UPI0022FE7B25|nr:uncharacterized protein BDB00DRAFT_816485 [Zychaea mexicana]KAI9494969.1 hypothetical protein BDB00DRAFT_816485 [Zychaea mexicana]